MEFLWEVLDKPFAELGLVQQVLVAAVVVGCILLVVCAISFARRLGERRIDARSTLFSPVHTFWRDEQGHDRESHGNCVDVSAGGLRIELPEPVEVGTSINFRLLNRQLSGTASVRHCTRHHSNYEIGATFRSISQ